MGRSDRWFAVRLLQLRSLSTRRIRSIPAGKNALSTAGQTRHHSGALMVDPTRW
jgi:hypothetical protein